MQVTDLFLFKENAPEYLTFNLSDKYQIFSGQIIQIIQHIFFFSKHVRVHVFHYLKYLNIQKKLDTLFLRVKGLHSCSTAIQMMFSLWVIFSKEK